MALNAAEEPATEQQEAEQLSLKDAALPDGGAEDKEKEKDQQKAADDAMLDQVRIRRHMNSFWRVVTPEQRSAARHKRCLLTFPSCPRRKLRRLRSRRQKKSGT